MRYLSLRYFGLRVFGLRGFGLRAPCLLALLALGACSSGSSSGGQHDAAVYDLALDLPPGCPPTTGNEKGVGLPCTKGGGECTKPGVPGGLLCTCDPTFGLQLNGVPCVCTLAGANLSTAVTDPCGAKPATLCGSNATCCNYMAEGYFCSPDVCLPGGACIDFTPADAGN
jgi:hypothetical protein